LLKTCGFCMDSLWLT